MARSSEGLSLPGRLAARWRGDILLRLTTQIIAVVLLGAALYAAWAIDRLHNHARDELQDRAQRMADVLAEALARPLFDINELAIRSVVDAARADADITLLHVSASDGTVLAKIASSERERPNLVTVSRDIRLRDGARVHALGRVEMALSPASGEARLNAQVEQIVTASLLFAILICAVLYLMGQRVALQFGQVRSAVEKLTRGDTRVQLASVGREDQVGEMAKAVMRFRDTLERLRLAESASQALLAEKSAVIGRMHAIFEGSHDAIMLLTESGFFDCNHRTLEMFGLDSREALVALHPADLSPAVQPDGRDSREAAAEEIAHAMKHGQNRFEWVHRRRDGREFPAEVLLSAFELDGRRVLQATVRDITERKLIERRMVELNDQLETRIAERTRELTDTVRLVAESQRKLQGIVDTALDAVVRVDAEGVIIGWNAQAEATFGWTEQEALGQRLDQTMIPPQHRDNHVAGMHRYVSTGEAHVINQRIELTALHRDGHEFPVELAITRVALEDLDKHEFCAFIRDITRRKKAEEEIRNSLERQRELNQLKSRFVSMASHEFRTPLATILSSSELLKYYAERMSAEERMDMLKTIETAVRRMTDMLDDVLLIGKSDADMMEFQPQPMALHALCDRLVQELRVGGLDLSRHRIVLSLQGAEPDAMFDEKLLRHIFGNLLSNAVKYSPQGGEVRFVVQTEQDQVRFTVSDEGLGMSEQDQQRLFETFFRGSNVGTISGTGLGLAIVKRSVDLHGGRIEVRSAPGKGSSFTVTLPCVRAQGTP